MRVLQAVVIIMAVLIFVGLGLVFYGIARKADPPKADPGTLGATKLDLPPGARVVDMAGTDGRLVLRVETGDGEQRLYVLDLDSGALLGTIDLGL